MYAHGKCMVQHVQLYVRACCAYCLLLLQARENVFVCKEGSGCDLMLLRACS